MNALVLTSGGLIAARILSSWLGAGHSVAAVWTGTKNPEQVLGRDRALGRLVGAWSMAALARRQHIPVLRNPKLSSPEAETEIARLGADVLITAMTHQIVPERILARFPGRAVNIHPALLPHYRGPNPRIGMLLDGTAATYGGITLHCLARGVDEGDIIGARAVPYDAARGFIDWDVRLAAAAGDLAQIELRDYLNGNLSARPQVPQSGSYRKVGQGEATLSGAHSAARTKLLCDQLAGSEWLNFRAGHGRKDAVSRFLGEIGPRTQEEPLISRYRIEFDTADARVAVPAARLPGVVAQALQLLARYRAGLALVEDRARGSRRASPASPIAERDALNDQPIDVDFGMRVFAPDALDRGITGACHPVHRIVRAIDRDDDGAAALAAKLAKRMMGRAGGKGSIGQVRPQAKDGKHHRADGERGESFAE